MKSVVNKIGKLLKKKTLLFICLLFLFFVVAQPARASVSDALLSGFGWIIYQIAYAIGMLFTFLLQFLIQVASWNNFVKSDVVTLGWGVVRDFCNMFFIFILLLIAFGTILQRDDYNAKKLLPKLLIMAVLINFSKTICGLLIDFSQVIMLTFVAAIGNGGNNLADLLGIRQMYEMPKDPNASSLATVAGLIIALLTTIACVIVVFAFIVTLISRIVNLWVYIVLSPLSYLLSAFPSGKKHADQWWRGFTENVIVGPVLAFFLWLTLATAQKTTEALVTIEQQGNISGSTVSGFLNNAVFAKSIITIGLLMAGLKMAQAAGGSAGGAIGKASERINKGQAWLTNRASRKVQDATGISAANQYASNWSASREATRKGKIEAQAVAISRGVGMAKQNTIGAAGKWASKKWGNRGRNQAEELRKEAYAEENMLGTLNNRDRLSHNGIKYSKDSDGNWSKAGDDGRELITENEIMETIKDSAKAKRSKADKHDENQKKWDNVLSNVVAVGGGAVGALATGGIGGFVAGGAASSAVLGALEGAKKAGDRDMGVVSKYNNEQIGKKRADMKDMEDDDIMSVVQSRGKGGHERAAAYTEMLSRGHKFGSDDKYLQEIDKQLGGDGNGAEFTDKKLKSTVKALQKSKDAGAHPDMQKAFGGDQEAVFNARQSFNDGSIKLGSMAAADIAKAVQTGMLDGMKLSAFGKAFTELGPQTQKVIKDALKKSASDGNYESKAKLAKVDNINTAGFTDEEKTKYVKGMTRKDLQDLINEGNNESKKALRDAVRGSLDNLPDDIRDSTGPLALEIKKLCGIMVENNKNN